MNRVAFFRPADERSESAATIIRDLGFEPLSDPMLAIEPTGDAPRSDAEYTIFTSKTGAELVSEMQWATDGDIVAIGAPTAEALEEAGYTVDRIPSEFSSTGLVADLAADAPGATIEVARSDHGSDVLLDGLNDAGAYVHETVLYRLVRPAGSGDSAVAAANSELAGVCFTSSLTVEHFLDAAEERDVRDAAIDGVNAATVGAIGTPTQETAERLGIEVDVVPETASFEALATAVVDRI